MSKIQFKRGVEADRLNQSPAFVPDAGEPIWVTDTNKLYVGDGSTEGGVAVSSASSDLKVLYTQTLDNPNAYNTPENDEFGRSVAISGNYAIVGAYKEDEASNNTSGKAYIFDVTTGSLLHTLDNPNAYNTSASDQFGFSVAISGNYAIVGADREDDASGNSSGKAYIFDVTTGSFLYTLDNPNPYSPSTNDYFGYSVSISGNYAIVGAYREDDAGGADSGKAYIFDATTGSLLYTLDNPNAYNTSASDQFGSSVAISGNYAIVGAYAEDDASPAAGGSSGKAYIYDISTFTSSTITSANYVLDNPNAYDISRIDYFGSSVAISGNYAIVGAYGENDAGGADSGKAYIYDISTFTTSTITTSNYVLDDPNAYSSSGSDYFGWSVAISGNYAIVGAYGEDDAGGTTSGKAYIYDISTFTSSTITDANYVLDNPNAYNTSQDDRFGYSVSISGNYAIAGAYLEDDATNPGLSSGKAYIFKTNGQDATYTGAEIASFAAGGALELISTTAIGTSVTQVDITSGFSSSYDTYYIDVVGFSTVATGNKKVEIQIYDNSSLLTGSFYRFVDDSGTTFQTAANIDIASIDTTRDDSGFRVSIFNANDAGWSVSSMGPRSFCGGGFYDSTNTGPITGFRLLFGAAVTGGNIRIYGVKNS